jgi:hypothetical protein
MSKRRKLLLKPKGGRPPNDSHPPRRRNPHTTDHAANAEGRGKEVRRCPNRRTVGGICLNLCLHDLECSLYPNSLCLIEAEAVKPEFMSRTRKRRLEKALEISANPHAACVMF